MAFVPTQNIPFEFLTPKEKQRLKLLRGRLSRKDEGSENANKALDKLLKYEKRLVKLVKQRQEVSQNSEEN